jgi:hypothetical protein
MESMSTPFPENATVAGTEAWGNKVGLPGAPADAPKAYAEFLPPPPRAMISRNDSKSSNKTLGDTFSSQGMQKPRRSRSLTPSGNSSPSPPPPKKSDLPLRNGDDSDLAPSIPPLALDRESATSSTLRPKSSYDFNDGLTPLPHQSFMIGPRYGPEQAKDSRFSWSTYAPTAPQTPSPYDENNNTRVSMASTVPRFRTIDSWVQHQNMRLDFDSVREKEREEEENRVPEVPKKFKTPGQNGVGTSGPLAGHGRNVSDASVFKKHPGQEVKHF